MAATLSARTSKLAALRSSVRRTPVARRTVQVHAATYKIKLILEGGKNVEIDCDSQTYILDAAEDQGVDLPYSCRAGSCSSCAGKVQNGTVDQSGQTYLTSEQMDKGYVLTCIAYPTSDLTLKSHVESELY